MRRALTGALGAGLGLSLLAPAASAQDTLAGDPAAGRKTATAVCQACHGLNGLPQQPEMPVIAGSDAAYLVTQLQAYKSGTRQNEMMAAVAPMLDEKQMADVAAYYAAVKVTATPP